MSARTRAVRPPCAVGRRTAPGRALCGGVARRRPGRRLCRAGRRSVETRRRRPGEAWRHQAGSVTPLLVGVVLATLLLSLCLTGFTAVVITGAGARRAAGAAAAGALQAWRAAAGEAGEPPDACTALAAFEAAYDAIRAAAGHYAAANGARLDPQRPPALVAGARGPAVVVAVLQPVRLGRYAVRLDPAHRNLRASRSAAWPGPATDWTATAAGCPERLPR